MNVKYITLFIEDERGTTAIEYAMIGALVSIVLVTAMNEVGGQLSGTFLTVGNVLEGDLSQPPQGLANLGGGGSGSGSS